MIKTTFWKCWRQFGSFLPWTKTENWHWDPRFSVRFKIHMSFSTILCEVLILVPNQNCARKSLCRDLNSLRSAKIDWNNNFCYHDFFLNIWVRVSVNVGTKVGVFLGEIIYPSMVWMFIKGTNNIWLFTGRALNILQFFILRLDVFWCFFIQKS